MLFAAIIVVRGDIMQVLMDDRFIDGIPVNEYFLPNVTNFKGVFFMMHGHTSSKDYGTGLFPKRLAELGYFAVTLDAYKHGLRKLEPYISGNNDDKVAEMPSVILETVRNISHLYKNYYSHFSPYVSIMGISMGAMIAWQLPKFLPNVKIVISLIGTPDFARLFDDINLDRYQSTTKTDLFKIISQLDIHDSIINYKDIQIYCANGRQDTLVNYQHTADFLLKHQNVFLTKPVLKLYDTSHDTPQVMIDDLFEWLKSKGE